MGRELKKRWVIDELEKKKKKRKMRNPGKKQVRGEYGGFRLRGAGASKRGEYHLLFILKGRGSAGGARRAEDALGTFTQVNLKKRFYMEGETFLVPAKLWPSKRKMDWGILGRR